MSGKRGVASARPADSLEIERKFLLRGMPVLPSAAEILRIEQGYLRGNDQPQSIGGDILHGRLRRTTRADGSIAHTHTVKSGDGLVRREMERQITPEQFNRAWPGTANRRLRKTRYRVHHGGLVWEVDVFDGVDLILAEVELPAADTQISIPDWLRPQVVREVTDDPAYTNVNIALGKLNQRPDGM